MNKITITRTDSGFALNVDGGNIECSTTAEVMSRVGHEMGMTFARANKEIFDTYQMLKKERDKIMGAVSKVEDENRTLRLENRELRAAIVACFVRAFKEG